MTTSLEHDNYGRWIGRLIFLVALEFKITMPGILERVYKQPQPNKYLAGFTVFLAENRGHYMIENIIQDGLNDFFFYHLLKYRESWLYPISFAGSVAFCFRDVIKEL